MVAFLSEPCLVAAFRGYARHMLLWMKTAPWSRIVTITKLLSYLPCRPCTGFATLNMKSDAARHTGTQSQSRRAFLLWLPSLSRIVYPFNPSRRPPNSKLLIVTRLKCRRPSDSCGKRGGGFWLSPHISLSLSCYHVLLGCLEGLGQTTCLLAQHPCSLMLIDLCRSEYFGSGSHCFLPFCSFGKHLRRVQPWRSS